MPSDLHLHRPWKCGANTTTMQRDARARAPGSSFAGRKSAGPRMRPASRTALPSVRSSGVGAHERRAGPAAPRTATCADRGGARSVATGSGNRPARAPEVSPMLKVDARLRPRRRRLRAHRQLFGCHVPWPPCLVASCNDARHFCDLVSASSAAHDRPNLLCRWRLRLHATPNLPMRNYVRPRHPPRSPTHRGTNFFYHDPHRDPAIWQVRQKRATPLASVRPPPALHMTGARVGSTSVNRGETSPSRGGRGSPTP